MCDKYGILVWDEFWQFNSVDPLDHSLFMANVRDKVLRIRNHPSIAIWCGRNEADPPKYLDDAVRNMLIELDPCRFTSLILAADAVVIPVVLMSGRHLLTFIAFLI